MTIPSQGGTNVSGGQRQRLAIARAPWRRTRISSCLTTAFRRWFQNRRSRTAGDPGKYAGCDRHYRGPAGGYDHEWDKILVMDQGKIIGEGTHEELLRTCGIYEQIAKTQLAGGGEEE